MMSKRSKSSEHGKAMVELAIIFPFLVFFAFSVFEVNRALKAKQITSRMAYELANIALRQCGGEVAAPNGGQNHTSFCLRANMGKIASQFDYLKYAGDVVGEPGSSLSLGHLYVFEEDPIMRVDYIGRAVESDPSTASKVASVCSTRTRISDCAREADDFASPDSYPCPPVIEEPTAADYRVRVRTEVYARVQPISPITEELSELLFGRTGFCSAVDIY